MGPAVLAFARSYSSSGPKFSAGGQASTACPTCEALAIERNGSGQFPNYPKSPAGIGSSDRGPASGYFTVRDAALETSPLGLVTTTASVFEPDGMATVTFNCEALTKSTWLPVYTALPTVTLRPAPD